MAKESMKAREVKREKTVAKYAEKRKALLEAGDFVGLQKLYASVWSFTCYIP
jgi:small subunit ribosomal protein S14